MKTTAHSALAQPELALNDSDMPALIVLGRDDTNKAHAAWFDQTEAGAATEAATLMGMMALPITTDEIRVLADKLPHGRIFGSGKAFVPFTKAATYDALIGHVPLAQQIKPLRIVRSQADGDSHESGGDKSPVVPSTPTGTTTLSMPKDWASIGPGCVVLAVADDKTEGWFEAVIIKAKGNSSFTLRWRDYPDEPNIDRPLVDLALMHPTRGVKA